MTNTKTLKYFYRLTLTAQMLFCPLSAAVFHEIDTTSPLLCTFSEKFQNRILVENGKVQKVISADEEKLSIFLEEVSGQAFIYARDAEPEETTLSVITNTGVVQDIQIAFSNRSSEVVILKDLNQEQVDEIEQKNKPCAPCAENIMTTVSDILLGNIPVGYFPCQVQCQQWSPKSGIVLDLMTKLEGRDSDLYLYQVTNTTKKQCQLMECELQFIGCRWVFLEANNILSKQTILGVFSVVKNDK